MSDGLRWLVRLLACITRANVLMRWIQSQLMAVIISHTYLYIILAANSSIRTSAMAIPLPFALPLALALFPSFASPIAQSIAEDGPDLYEKESLSSTDNSDGFSNNRLNSNRVSGLDTEDSTSPARSSNRQMCLLNGSDLSLTVISTGLIVDLQGKRFVRAVRLQLPMPALSFLTTQQRTIFRCYFGQTVGWGRSRGSTAGRAQCLRLQWR